MNNNIVDYKEYMSRMRKEYRTLTSKYPSQYRATSKIPRKVLIRIEKLSKQLDILDSWFTIEWEAFQENNKKLNI